MHPPRNKALVRVLVASAVGLALAGVAGRMLAATVLQKLGLVPEISLSLRPGSLGFVGPLPVTNTLLSAWLASTVLAGLFLLARWGPKAVRRKIRAAADLLLEAIFSWVRGLAGEEKARRLFPLAASFFLYLLANAWAAVLPLYGPIYAVSDEGSRVTLLRSAGTDINMTLALAILAGIVVEGAGFLTQAHRTSAALSGWRA